MSGTGVPEGFTLPWNTTVTMADVWRRSLDTAAKAKAEKAELRRLADAAAGYRPVGKIPYAGRGK